MRRRFPKSVDVITTVARDNGIHVITEDFVRKTLPSTIRRFRQRRREFLRPDFRSP